MLTSLQIYLFLIQLKLHFSVKVEALLDKFIILK